MSYTLQMNIFRYSIAFLVLLAAACTNQVITCYPSQPQPIDALRVLTYNIHHGVGLDGRLDLERIAAVINESGADLVALQEVDVLTSRTDNIDQIATLARLTNMYGAFTPFMDFQDGQYGLAVLSRYHIQNARPIKLPPGKHEPRSALAVDVFIPGHAQLTFISLHLDWLDDDTERFTQAEALVAALESEHGVILAGDFNDTPNSQTIRLFDKTYANAQKPKRHNNTYPANNPDREIDFVMYRPAYAWSGSSRVLDERVASDHRPVLAILEWVR